MEGGSSRSLYFTLPAMKNEMEPTSINEELMKVILIKLNRLETRFNDIDVQIKTIESTMVSGISTLPGDDRSPAVACCWPPCANPPQLPPQSARRKSLSHEKHLPPPAAAYKVSVEKLRRNFEFEADPSRASVIREEEKPIPPRAPADDKNGGGGRRKSEPPPRPPRPESMRGVHCCCNSAILGPQSSRIPSRRYEDSTPSVKPLGSPVHSRSSSTSSHAPSKHGSVFDIADPPSTARTSFASDASTARPSEKPTDDPGHKTARFSIQWDVAVAAAATGLGKDKKKKKKMMKKKKKKKTTTTHQSYAAERKAPLATISQGSFLAAKTTLITMVEEEERELLRFRMKAQNGAKACISFGRKIVYGCKPRIWVINQQRRIPNSSPKD